MELKENSLDNNNNQLFIELGPQNTIFMQNGNILLSEPSVLAYDKTDSNTIVTGKTASFMEQEVKNGLESAFNFCHPFQHDTIRDLRLAKLLFRNLLQRSNAILKKFGRNDVFVVVPAGIAPTQASLISEILKDSGIRHAQTVNRTFALLHYNQVDVLDSKDSMLVDCSDQDATISVVGLGGIVKQMNMSCDLPIGSDEQASQIIYQGITAFWNHLRSEIVADIQSQGIYLNCHNDVLTNNLSNLLSNSLHIPVHISPEPALGCIYGAADMVNHFDQYPFLILKLTDLFE